MSAMPSVYALSNTQRTSRNGKRQHQNCETACDISEEVPLSLIIKQWPDLQGPFYHYGNQEKIFFSPKNWLYLWEQKTGEMKPLWGVTGTLKIVDKSPQLIPWSIKQVVNRAYAHLVAQYGRLDGFVEMTAEDLMDALEAAKKEPDDILVAAGNTGHAAHAHVEALVNATTRGDEGRRLELLAKFPEDDRATNCVIAALCFFVDHNVRFVSSEQRVFSRSLEVAGTLDGHIIMDSCEDKSCGCQQAAPFKDMSVCLDMKTSNHVHHTYFAQAGIYRFAKCEEFPLTKFDATVILRMGKDDAAEFEPWFAFGDTLYKQHVDFFVNALNLKKSVIDTERWMWDTRDTRRKIEREKKDAAKAEALALDCGHKTYKGVRKPQCNGGNPCKKCKQVYAAAQAAREAK